MVSVFTQDDLHPLAKTCNYLFVLNIKKSSAEPGFRAAATLLTALNAWILTNIQMHLQIDEAQNNEYAQYIRT